LIKSIVFLLFSSVYELPFYTKKIPQGFYTIHLTLTPGGEGKFAGLTDNTVRRKCFFRHKIMCLLD
jgi:hypothetical protein